MRLSSRVQDVWHLHPEEDGRLSRRFWKRSRGLMRSRLARRWTNVWGKTLVAKRLPRR